MFDEKQQIEYWKHTAEEDIDTAEILFEKNKLKECLFFCHLSIEKILKAHYVKKNKELAPKTHNLIYLQRESSLILENEQIEFLTFLIRYQLEGRYPDYKVTLPSKENIIKIIFNTKELFKWLIQIL